jgi:hypothetical protein
MALTQKTQKAQKTQSELNQSTLKQRVLKQNMLTEIDTILNEFVKGDGDIFVVSEVKDFAELEGVVKQSSPYALIEDIYKKILYAKDEYAFAIILKTTTVWVLELLNIRMLGSDKWDQVRKRLEANFYTKNKNFIDQVWYWIVHYNLWYTIQFVSNILLAFKL